MGETIIIFLSKYLCFPSDCPLETAMYNDVADDDDVVATKKVTKLNKRKRQQQSVQFSQHSQFSTYKILFSNDGHDNTTNIRRKKEKRHTHGRNL